MLNQRHAAAQKVAAHLMPAEADLQETIVKNARLQIAIVEARRESRAPKNLGVTALVHLADAGRSLAEAWRSTTEAHKALHEDQRLGGLSAFAYGEVDDTPSTAPSGIVGPQVLKVA